VSCVFLGHPARAPPFGLATLFPVWASSAALGSQGTSWSVADYLAVVGLALTAIGFSVTLWQLTRTANAAVATKNAVLATSRTQLLMLLPQVRLIETELDWAISLAKDGREFASRVLTSYVHLAHEVAGLITVHGLADQKVCDAIRSTANLAATTKNKLYSSKSSLASITTEFRSSLAALGGTLSAIGATQQSAAVTD
jgi:hypothetical protein